MADHNDKTMKDEANCLYIVRPGIVHTSVGGHFYIVPPSGPVEVNETAMLFWKRMEKGAFKEDLLELALSKYEVDDKELLRRDVDTFIQMCLMKQLIMEK